MINSPNLDIVVKGCGLKASAADAARAWLDAALTGSLDASEQACFLTKRALEGRVERLLVFGRMKMWVQDSQRYVMNAVLLRPEYPECGVPNGTNHFPAWIASGSGGYSDGNHLMLYAGQIQNLSGDRVDSSIAPSFEFLNIWHERLKIFLRFIGQNGGTLIREACDELIDKGTKCLDTIIKSIQLHEARHAMKGTLAEKAMMPPLDLSEELTNALFAVGDIDADTWFIGDSWDLNVGLVTVAYQLANLRHENEDESDFIGAAMLLNCIADASAPAEKYWLSADALRDGFAMCRRKVEALSNGRLRSLEKVLAAAVPSQRVQNCISYASNYADTTFPPDEQHLKGLLNAFLASVRAFRTNGEN